MGGTVDFDEKKIRRQVEKLLDPYYEYKEAIKLGTSYLLPRMVANYDVQPTAVKDLPIMRMFVDVLKHTDYEEVEREEKIIDFFNVLKKFHPEALRFNSSTEQYGIKRAEESSDIKKRLEEKNIYIQQIDRALECLTEEQRKIIEYSYLQAKPNRLKPDEVAAKIKMPRKKFFEQKKEAITRIAKIFNIL